LREGFAEKFADRIVQRAWSSQRDQQKLDKFQEGPQSKRLGREALANIETG
jgi:hypothetical protein